MELAPIVLFVYNRPVHTLQTLEALAKNDYAKESRLFVYADGPKKNATSEDLKKIHETELVIRSKEWCKETIFVKRERNFGLADNIVDGVTALVTQFERVIVLEDDIITSQGFLKYMNEALTIYSNDDQVMHISAFMFPVRGKLPGTFFYRQASCWGWGTWKRAWKFLELNPRVLLKKLESSEKIKEADIDGTGQFLRQLELNIKGEIKTWAVKWHFTIALRDGLCLHPGKSLVRNIGLDGSGENSGRSNLYHLIPTEYVDIKRIGIHDYKAIYPLLKSFYSPKKKTLANLKSRLAKRIPSNIIRYIKRIQNKSLRETYKEQQRLLKMPRFVSTSTIFLDRKIELADSASFLFTKAEIFDEQIYKFRADNSSPYIIDCGANIGLSVIYFKVNYPGAEVVAFEPDKNIFKILHHNINAFKFEKITLINKGLWNEATTLRFYAEGADGGRIATDDDLQNVSSIETIRLREFLNKPVDFLKIDIEGAEIKVLKDCSDLLHNVKNLFVEYHSFVEKEQELDQLLLLLSSSGFRYVIQQHGVVSKMPFLTVRNQSGMDILLNISAYRK